MTETALITGASSGIGKALAGEFATRGYNLVLVAENPERLNEVLETIKRRVPSINCTAICKDLKQEESPQELYNELVARNCVIDVLVNNAGVGQSGKFSNIPLEKEIEIIRLNVEAVTRLIRIFLPGMLQRNKGKILNVGSIAGFEPGPFLSVYHASKAFVNSLSNALAEELKDTPVTVTCLCPGPTDTNFFKRADMLDTRVYQRFPLQAPETVAEMAFEALISGKRVVVPGGSNKVLTFLRRILPESTQAKMNKKFYERVEPGGAGQRA